MFLCELDGYTPPGAGASLDCVRRRRPRRALGVEAQVLARELSQRPGHRIGIAFEPHHCADSVLYGPTLPQCGFPALRSSEGDSQLSDSLQLPIWEF
jgi:hypothetical protein